MGQNDDEVEVDFRKAVDAYFTREDHEAAFPLMKRCAEADHPMACFLLAIMFESAEGTQRDQAEYRYWLDRLLHLAELGNSTAQWEVSCKYRWGNHFPIDLARANHWLEEAAKNGHPDAQHHLGWYLETGQFEYEKNPELARAWHEKALDSHHPEAIYDEALKHFELGRPTEKALALLREASDRGLKQATDTLQTYMN